MPLGIYRERVLLRAKQMLARAHEHQVSSKEEAIQKAIHELVQEEQGKLAQREKILAMAETPDERHQPKVEDPDIKKAKNELEELSQPDAINSLASLLKDHKDLAPFGQAHLRASWIRGLMFDPNIGKNHTKVNQALPENLRFGDSSKLADIISKLPAEPSKINYDEERSRNQAPHPTEPPEGHPPTLEDLIRAMTRGHEE